MDSNLPAVQICPKCNGNMITRGDGLMCFDCDKPKPPAHWRKPPPVPNKAVSAAEFQKLTGITSNTPDAPQLSKPTRQVVGSNAVDALDIMRNLPIPKDEKEFKQIRKIITLLEQLVGEK